MQGCNFYAWKDDAPAGVFRRHDKCNCEIVYENGRTRQNLKGAVNEEGQRTKKWEVVDEVNAPPPKKFSSDEQPKGFSPKVLTNGAADDIINKKALVSDKVVEHSNIGTFTALKDPNNPQKGGGNFKNGGHGQDNLDELDRRGIKYHIVKEYDNGVRAGYVPDHKEKSKKTGLGQAWFPKDWTDDDIKKAGEYVLSKKEIIFENKDENGNIISYTIFGEYNGVTVGIITDKNGSLSNKDGTIFPDSLQRKIGDFNA